MAAHTRTIEYLDEDEQILEDYKDTVETLANLVIEMIQVHSGILLSPIFRQMLVDKAKETIKKHERVRRALCVDIPHSTLSPKTEKEISIQDFYDRVCRRAEKTIEETHKVEGAHFAAMQVELDLIRKGGTL